MAQLAKAKRAENLPVLSGRLVVIIFFTIVADDCDFVRVRVVIDRFYCLLQLFPVYIFDVQS